MTERKPFDLCAYAERTLMAENGILQTPDAEMAAMARQIGEAYAATP